MSEKKRIYCAIYTRKSTNEGMDQEFTSLDAQRESALNYIASQKNEGWTPLAQQYDDAGCTGANLDRPAVQQLLNDIKDGIINCIVVYKVDRLSRSLLDFAKLLEFFDQHNVTFVSITQHFNTQTSMGRLTLNILLSFAQFEREMISERTRDKMGAARMKGKWLGGKPPLGYDFDRETRKLKINGIEAKLIRHIFELYIRGNYIRTICQLLNEKGYTTKKYTAKTGKTFGGFKFGNSNIQSLLNNVIYIGKAKYAGQIYEGEHEPIISEEIFNKTQSTLAKNRVVRNADKNTKNSGMLNSILRCKTCDSPMFYTYTIKRNKHKYNYYVCAHAYRHRDKQCPARSVTAEIIEKAVIDCLKNAVTKDEELEKVLSVWHNLFVEEKRKALSDIVKEVSFNGNDSLEITLRKENLRFESKVDLKRIKHTLPYQRIPNANKEPLIRLLLVLAHQIQELLDQGKVDNFQKIAKWLNMSCARSSQITSLFLLSPDIKREILLSDARKIHSLSEYKLQSIISELNWEKQERLWKTLKSQI